MVEIELINYSRLEMRHALVDWRTYIYESACRIYILDERLSKTSCSRTKS